MTKPIDEASRMQSLESLCILDTPPEERYDRITRLAQRLFNVETCLISLVDAERQWFKSKQGLDVCETSRAEAFCAHTILTEHTMVVHDARKDDRFATNPLVTGDPHIRFYAGCPIHGPLRKRIGTLCIIDSKPRIFSNLDRDALQDFASIVDDELAMANLATVDELTQVANRRGFYSVANKMLALCRRTTADAELLYFDLDGLKEVNDQMGHTQGDALLQNFARLLTKTFRSADVIARLGGDEFVVLLTASKLSSDKPLIRLQEAAENSADEKNLVPSWSIGRVRFDPAVHDSIDTLLDEADVLMYDEKLSKRQRK